VQDSVEEFRDYASPFLGKLLGTSLQNTVEVPAYLLQDVQDPAESQQQTEQRSLSPAFSAAEGSASIARRTLKNFPEAPNAEDPNQYNNQLAPFLGP